MKKQQYIKPATSIVKSYMERVMTAVSKTHTETPDGTPTDGPEYAGPGKGDDMAKKNNAWSNWDE